VKLLAIKLFVGSFRVCALAKGNAGEDCPTLDFLNELEAKKSHDYGRLMRYLEWTSSKLLVNEEQFKAVGDGIFEFRARDGARLFCFLDSNAVILCTNGYVKKKQKITPTELERAKNWRSDYFAAKSRKELIFKDEEDL
jgi:hypothetical protein